MSKEIKMDWLKNNAILVAKFLWSQAPGFGASAVAIGVLFITGHVEWGNRLAEARLSEYQQITQQVEEANALLERYTRTLALHGNIDADTLDTLAENLSVQYSRIGRFESNLSADNRQISQAYRSSLNRLKHGLITAQSVNDLEFVGADIAEMYGMQARLVPILAAAAGTNDVGIRPNSDL